MLLRGPGPLAERLQRTASFSARQACDRRATGQARHVDNGRSPPPSCPSSAPASCMPSPRWSSPRIKRASTHVPMAPTPARQGMRTRTACGSSSGSLPFSSRRSAASASKERVPSNGRKAVSFPSDWMPSSSRRSTASIPVEPPERFLSGSHRSAPSIPMERAPPRTASRQWHHRDSATSVAADAADPMTASAVGAAATARARAPIPFPQPSAPSAAETRYSGMGTMPATTPGGQSVMLTPGLASRLLADLLEAYQHSSKLEDAQSSVARAWGLADADEMNLCIEAQANASYVCCAATS